MIIRLKQIFFIIILLTLFFSCKKNTPVPPITIVTPPPTSNKVEIDTSKLKGLWKFVSGKNALHNSWYFGDDHFFQQDYASYYTPSYNATWSFSANSTLMISGLNPEILKLTSDSLVVNVYGITWRFKRLPIVESGYELTTLTRNQYIQTPLGITEDPQGNIYFGEKFGERIRKISTNNSISTVAGIDPTNFRNIIIGLIGRNNALTIDKDGSLITGGEFPQVARISLTSNILTKLAGQYKSRGQEDVPALESNMEDVLGVAVDSEGNIYECESLNQVVRKISKSTGKINTIVGKYPVGSLQPFNKTPGTGLNVLFAPTAIAFDANQNLYITDALYNCVWKYFPTGELQLIAGKGYEGFSGDGGLAINATLSNPTAIAVDNKGNIYISDTGNQRIRKISAINQVITTIAGNGLRGENGDWKNSSLARLNGPMSIYVEPDGDVIFSDVANNLIRKLNLKNK